MLVQVTAFDGQDLDISGIQATVLNPGAMPAARPVFIEQTEADQLYSGTFSVDLRNVTLQLKVTDYLNRYALIDQIKGMFKRGRRGDLEVYFSDDEVTYRMDCVVITPPIQDATFPQYFTVVLQSGDSAWVAKEPETTSIEVSDTGDTETLSVGGNDETRLSVAITPTVGPSVGYLYKRRYQIVNSTPQDFGLFPWCMVIDHAALVSASKSQADGDDLRVWLGDVEAKRWITGANTDTCKIWFNIQINAGKTLVLDTAVPSSGAVTELAFQRSSNTKVAINSMPGNGIIGHGDELFYYTGRDAKNYKLTGVTRAVYGTAEEAHSQGDTFALSVQPVYLLYGNAAVGDPADEDDAYDDEKPLFDLEDSDNETWVYDDTTLFADPDLPNRPGAWKSSVIRYSLNEETYTYPIKGDAVSGDPAIGGRMTNYLKGSTWKPDSVQLGWTLYHGAGFSSITATGRKYRSSTVWAKNAQMRVSANGSSWISLWDEASPSAAEAFEAWATHEDVAIDAGRYYVQLYFASSFPASPHGAYALTEGLTVTLNMVSANLPTGTLGSEQNNAHLQISIENLDNGDRISLEIPVEINKAITVDGENNMVLFDGASIYRSLELNDASRAAWIRLAPGDNDIQISGDDLGTLDVDLKYYRRRLY